MTYISKRWGSLRRTHIHQSVFKDGKLSLPTCALAVLTILLYKQKGYKAKLLSFPYDITAVAKLKRDELITRSGFSVNKVTAALRTLRDQGYIEQRLLRRERNGKAGQFSTAEYVFLYPDRKLPMHVQPRTNLLYDNRVPYFIIPRCIIHEPFQLWSMANMSSPELRVYFGCLFPAQKARRNEFQTTVTDLKRMLDLCDPRTVRARLESLEDKNLIFTFVKPESVTIELNDPYTAVQCSFQTVITNPTRRISS